MPTVLLLLILAITYSLLGESLLDNKVFYKKT